LATEGRRARWPAISIVNFKIRQFPDESSISDGQILDASAFPVIDSHCHLADDVFVADLAAVVERAKAAGVESALCILSADEPEEVARAASVTAAWAEVRFAAAIHPHRAGAYAGRAADASDVVRRAVDAVGAVALGEMGLDYHYDFAPKSVQKDVFAAQVDLAAELGLPVIIHTREAMADTLAILRPRQDAVRGVMHCFTGTPEEARQALDIGFYVSLSGIVTFPKAGALVDVARLVPDDRLLIETDAPFLAPVPHRGKRNEPAWVAETLGALAKIRGVDREGLSAAIRRNFMKFAGLPER
jgi:TatD DNase family protein